MLDFTHETATAYIPFSEFMLIIGAIMGMAVMALTIRDFFRMARFPFLGKAAGTLIVTRAIYIMLWLIIIQYLTAIIIDIRVPQLFWYLPIIWENTHMTFLPVNLRDIQDTEYVMWAFGQMGAIFVAGFLVFGIHKKVRDRMDRAMAGLRTEKAAVKDLEQQLKSNKIKHELKRDIIAPGGKMGNIDAILNIKTAPKNDERYAIEIKSGNGLSINQNTVMVRGYARNRDVEQALRQANAINAKAVLWYPNANTGYYGNVVRPTGEVRVIGGQAAAMIVLANQVANAPKY